MTSNSVITSRSRQLKTDHGIVRKREVGRVRAISELGMTVGSRRIIEVAGELDDVAGNWRNRRPILTGPGSRA